MSPIPQSPQIPLQTVLSKMQLKTFLTPPSPIREDLEKLDNEINAFLVGLDGRKRVLNGRNAYAVKDKICVQVWYLEEREVQPEIRSLGKQQIRGTEKSGNT